MFYDDPGDARDDGLHNRIRYQTLEQGFWEANVDVVILSEDMAYKAPP